MYFDRGALKRRAKSLVTQGTPPAWQVTLIFLLATTAISTVVNFVLPNPVDQIYGVYNNWLNDLTVVIGSGGQVSQGAVDVLYQQIWNLFQGPMATVGLLVGLMISFYAMVVNLGYYGYALRVMRGQEGGGFGTLFSQFHMAGKIILMNILQTVFITLWSMLFVIPGIVAAYRYRMAGYALLDDPNISALEAIRRSKRLMQGRKGSLFVLDLSFLGWMILAALVVLIANELTAMLQIQLIMMGLTGVANVISALVSLAATLATNMFLTCYITLADAGFYLFVLGNQAPPVGEGGYGPGGGWNQGGPGTWDQSGPNDANTWGNQPPFDGNEGWNQ